MILDYNSITAHKTAHKEKMRKFLYIEAKIHDADGDISKRWYVYFSYINPSNGEMTRQPNRSFGANRSKNKKERYKLLQEYCDITNDLLKQGYTPYSDTETYLNINLINKKTYTISSAFEYALNKKQNQGRKIAKTTIDRYRQTSNKLIEFMKSVGVQSNTDVNVVKKNLITSFIEKRLQTVSSATTDNNLTDIKALFQVMQDDDIIAKNPCSGIKKDKPKPVKNKTYTPQELSTILDYLENNDKQMKLFILFIGYEFMRPVEICRLKIKDIDLNNRLLIFKAKNRPVKTKIIVEPIYKELIKLEIDKLNPEFSLFTRKNIPLIWDIPENEKRVYFSNLFGKYKKKLGFNDNYGLYSFRHTFITKLYREYRKNLTPYEAKSNLMLVTGHETMEALSKYLRDIEAELPEDYSHLLK